MKKVILFTLILILAASTSFAAQKWAVGVIGSDSQAKLLLDGAELNIIAGMNTVDTDNSATTIGVSYLVKNKLGTGLDWKIGGGLTVISAKVAGTSGSSNIISFLVGVDYSLTDKLILEFVVAPIAITSTSFGGDTSSGNSILGGKVGFSYIL